MGVLEELGMTGDDLREALANVPARCKPRMAKEPEEPLYLDEETILREGIMLDEYEYHPPLLESEDEPAGASLTESTNLFDAPARRRRRRHTTSDLRSALGLAS